MPDASLSKSRLFEGLKFFVSHTVSERNNLLRTIRDHGGQIAALEKQADLCLINPHARPPAPVTNHFSYEFVGDCVKNGILQDKGDYQVGLTSHADRRVGSTLIAAKSTRNAFTGEDDQILYNWAKPYQDAQRTWKGNEIYKQLARRHPQHTFQSWRSRYLDHVQFMKLNITETIDLCGDDGAHGPETEDIDLDSEQRPTKRRRIKEPRSAIALLSPGEASARLAPSSPAARSPQTSKPEKDDGSTHPRVFSCSKEAMQVQVSLQRERCVVTPGSNGHGETTDSKTTPDPANPAQKDFRTPNREQAPKVRSGLGSKNQDCSRQSSQDGEGTDPDDGEQNSVLDAESEKLPCYDGFTLGEVRGLYTAVPYIYNTSPEKIQDSWKALAEHWETHTADKWERYYHEKIVPEYMRRNRLNNTEELENHISDILVKDLEKKTPKVKQEPWEQDQKTPADKQRDEELARARTEAEEIELSEESQGQRSAAVPDAETNKLLVRRGSPPLPLRGDSIPLQAQTRPQASMKQAPVVAEAPPSNLASPASLTLARRPCTSADDRQANPTDREASPVVEPILSFTSRHVILANEGRKRASQQTNSTSSPSIPSFSASQPTSPFRGYLQQQGRYDSQIENQSQDIPQSQPHSGTPKKRLFGRTLDLSPSQPHPTQDERDSFAGPLPIELRQIESEIQEQERSFVSKSSFKTATTVSTSSIPNSQLPPESYQRPPKSASTSQEEPSIVSTGLASYDTAKGVQTEAISNVAIAASMSTISQPPTTAPSYSPQQFDTKDDRMVDLLGTGELDHDDNLDDKTELSDTGSEYNPFPEGPERSQMWYTEAAEDQAVDFEKQAADDEDDDSVGDFSSPRRKFRKALITQTIRPPTPVRNKARFEEYKDENGDDDDENEFQHGNVSVSDSFHFQYEELPRIPPDPMVQRLETQPIFRQEVLVEDESTLFDIPPPEGGWDKLGIDLDEEDTDMVVGSIERPDNPSVKYSSPVLSRSRSDSFTSRRDSSKAEQNEDNLVKADPPRQIYSISDDEQTESSSEDEVEIQPTPMKPSLATIKQEFRSSPPRARGRVNSFSSDRMSSHTTGSTRESTAESDTSSSDSQPDGKALQNWMQAQQKLHSTMPEFVFKRLASTALNSTMCNLSSSTLLFRTIATSFMQLETSRREAAEQSIFKRSFKPTKKLSESEALDLLPKDVYGVWTYSDDEDLLSRETRRIENVERKHGRKGVQRRAKFLEYRYGLKGGRTSKSISATPAAGKRRLLR